ncbi:hypothetical protein RND81_04G038200 [Saponaria officinalis]|uniref:Uncharacterized protein n=1 Tax=Saponaria officinalis TaxID=3572 RepID=A0AAW1LIF7_SAPOF
MHEFPSVSAYFQRLKSLADQLKNVGSPVSNSRLVLQLVYGLAPAYHGVGTIIRQRDPLPDFARARSMFTLEESGLAKQAATSSPMAMYAKGSSDGDNGGSSKGGVSNAGKGGRGNGSGKKKGKGKGNSGNKETASAPSQVGSTAPVPGPGQWSGYGAWQWPSPPWGYPPCPYPTGPWVRPGVSFRQQPGILGPRPAQAYTAAAGSAPTQMDIEAAMYTPGLTPPEPWVMDTGATSHMTANPGFADGDSANEV